MNPFHRKGPLEKVGGALGDAADNAPKALAAVGGVAALAAASAVLSSVRRRRQSADDT